jgi:hypothetical protein
MIFVFKRLYAALVWQDHLSNCKSLGATGETQSRRTSFAFICLRRTAESCDSQIVASQIVKRLEKSANIEAMTQTIHWQSIEST